MGSSGYFGAFYKHQRARGKKASTAITIVTRRMCRIVWHLLQDKRPYLATPPTKNTETISPAASI